MMYNIRVTSILLLTCLSIIILCACNTRTNIEDANIVKVSVAPHKTEPTTTPLPSATPSQSKEQVKNNKIKTVPILYYHNVSDKIWGIKELFVSPIEFEKQMNFLKINNYNVITFDQLDDVEYIENPVIITFDDGYENNYLEAYPILKKFNYKATIFICTNFINGSSILKESQIQQMTDLINFQSHTLSHPDVTKLNNADLEHELAESKKIIEQMTNTKVEVFAYPTGYYNKSVIDIVKKYYKYAVLNTDGLYAKGVNNYEIKRIYIPRNLDIKAFEKKILKGTSD